MNTPIDFSTYKFRCSSLPNLMTASRSKTEPLSETTKSYLRELWIKEVYGREKFDTSNKYTEKGIMCEPDSMDLVQKVTKQTYFKNTEKFENEFVNGTPDIVLKKGTPDARIKDIKSSWNIWTFNSVTEDSARKSYYFQMLGYMWLTGAKVADLIYCLVNTPEEIMNDELYKLSFRFPEINESDEKANRFKVNYIFDDISPELRMKQFMIQFNEEDIAQLKEKIVLSRQYMETITL